MLKNFYAILGKSQVGALYSPIDRKGAYRRDAKLRKPMQMWRNYEYVHIALDRTFVRLRSVHFAQKCNLHNCAFCT